MLSLVEMAEEGPLGHEAEQSNDQWGQYQSQPETDPSANPLRDGEGDKGPNHIERAVGDIGNTQHAQDETQPSADNKQDHGPAESNQQLGNQFCRTIRHCPHPITFLA